jgi:glycosyltransferase involved in cell wall biosynthesis
MMQPRARKLAAFADAAAGRGGQTAKDSAMQEIVGHAVPLPAHSCVKSGSHVVDKEGLQADFEREQKSDVRGNLSTVNEQPSPVTRIALLTGGGDKHYAVGITTALTSLGIQIDFIGSDDLKVAEVVNNRRVNFLNLRRNQRSEANLIAKAFRVLAYYVRLMRYAATAKPKLFHILWNNKFEFFDRTLLMRFYKLLGKKIVLTAHNVNAGKRDSNDSWLNRLSLKIQYNLSDHIFVHTKGMKNELVGDFRVPSVKVSVIPFGINNTVPNSSLSSAQAKRQLGVSSSDKTMLFFGNIAPYKGLEYLIAAFSELVRNDRRYRLLIVGKPKGRESYWRRNEQAMSSSGVSDRVIRKIEYVPDRETEWYFKAADVLILPYTHIFQSGVLFLGYNFGLPVIAADVGSLKEEILEGETGFVFRPQDSSDLAQAIRRYFASELFSALEARRPSIRQYANERYSWSKVSAITTAIYCNLLKANVVDRVLPHDNYREPSKEDEAAVCDLGKH